MRLFTFLILLFFYTPAFSKVFITINPRDCLNCSSGLYVLSKSPHIPEIFIVMMEEFESDSIEIEELFEFTRFEKIKILYSDSLYNAKSQNIRESDFSYPELIIEDENGVEQYRSLMIKLDHARIEQVMRALSAKPLETEECFESINRKGMYLSGVDRHSAVFRDVYGLNHCVYDLRSDSTSWIPKARDLIIDLYKNYFQENFSQYFPVMQGIMEEMPTFKPKVEDVVMWKNAALIHFELKDFKIRGEDTGIYGKFFLGKFNPGTGKMDGYFNLDSFIRNRFFIWNIYVGTNDLYLRGGYISGGLAVLSVDLDESSKTVQFKKGITLKHPVSYTVNNVPPYEADNICFNADCLAFIYSDSLINLKTNQRIGIPFPVRASPENYDINYIQDIYYDEKFYYVLYIHKKDELYLLKFDPGGEAIYNKRIGRKDDAKIYSSKFWGSGEQLIYRGVQSDCYTIMNVSSMK